jgi:PAS domain S-box-containing protein
LYQSLFARAFSSHSSESGCEISARFEGLTVTTLHEVQLLLASIVESSDDAIISKDLNGIVTSWNRSAVKIFGYTADEMIGRPISTLAAPDRINEMPTILDRIRRGERIDHYETRRRAKSGQIIDISVTISPIRSQDGQVVGASKIARDITANKLAEKAVIEQAERLARSNADLQDFAYITSHDLQEPLRTIATFSELLRRRYSGQLDRQADQYVDLVITAATRMSALIRDSLSFSHLVRQESVAPVSVPSDLMVQWAIENLQSRIQECGAVIERGALPVVNVDKSAMSQVFQNLLSNAIKYRQNGAPPHIRIDAETNEKECIFSVADNGIGIPASYHQTIFGLFKRLHASGYEGTGIGLALCKRIVEKHGGRIWVESEPGKGSVFRFTIPRREADDAN